MGTYSERCSPYKLAVGVLIGYFLGKEDNDIEQVFLAPHVLSTLHRIFECDPCHVATLKSHSTAYGTISLLLFVCVVRCMRYPCYWSLLPYPAI